MARNPSSSDEPSRSAATAQPSPKRRAEKPSIQDAGTDEGLSFEQSAARLSEIVEKLERGDLPLEQSLKLFEEGVGVARAAQAHLEQAERRVEELLGLDEQQEPITRDLSR